MRNQIVDNLRGLCLLGVVAIHVGSLALEPNNFVLYALLEILSRYSVPSFFFISGYGLFCGLGKYTSYTSFLKKRLQSAGLPYVSWSLFYLLYFWCILPPDYINWEPLHVAYVLFFGLACYHLYFMVILLWFYLFFPLWRRLLQMLEGVGLGVGLAALFLFQLAFNYWTTHPGVNISSWSPLWQNFFNYRLNYLPFHYIFIFMLGAVAAVRHEQWLSFLKKYFTGISIFYVASTIYILGSAYYAFHYRSYSLLDLANTYHQLSPQGLCYTLGSILFFCAALPRLKESSYLNKAIVLLSSYSMLIYFIHPLLLEWMTSFYVKFGIVMTVKKVSLSYFILLIGSLLFSMFLNWLFQRCSWLSLTFTGRK